MVRAAAMADFSTTLTNSRNRSSRCMGLLSPFFVPAHGLPLPGGRPGAASALVFVGGQVHPPRAVLADAQRVVGLHELVDLARALVDDRGLAVAVEAAHRVLVREA